MDLAAGGQAPLGADGAHHKGAASPELVRRCGYPLTAPGAVKRVYTNLAILDVTARGFVVLDMAPGLSLDALQRVTDAPLKKAA